MKQILLLVALSAAFAACQPDPEPAKLLDQYVVSTNFASSANFSSYSTFSLATDTIGFISNNTNDTILIASQSSLVRPILSKIEQNMLARGYTRVAKSENPDLRINVFIMQNIDYYQQVVYPGGYYPYYGYGGGYGYGGYYYPYVQTYESNYAALIIEMVDLVHRTVDNKVQVVWTASMGDVANAVDRQKQTVDGIDQAFIQSPYIQK